jgi:transcription elongation factor GreA
VIPVVRIELSAETRRALEERLHRLDDLASALKLQWAESGDPAARAALEAVGRETARLREALLGAQVLEEEVHDATLAEFGDTVTIRMDEDSGPERFKLVSEFEARLDDTWISVEAPMGRALLGRRIGEEVEVVTPAGLARYEILSIDRDPP